MPTVEERLANLEGRVNEHTQTFTAMRDTLSLMRDAVGSLERRFDRLDERMDKRFDTLEARFDLFQDRTLTRFGWLIALFITSTIAIITTILTRG